MYNFPTSNVGQCPARHDHIDRSEDPPSVLEEYVTLVPTKDLQDSMKFLKSFGNPITYAITTLNLLLVHTPFSYF